MMNDNDRNGKYQDSCVDSIILIRNRGRNSMVNHGIKLS